MESRLRSQISKALVICVALEAAIWIAFRPSFEVGFINLIIRYPMNLPLLILLAADIGILIGFASVS